MDAGLGAHFTAKFHVSTIYAKFGVHARQDLLDVVAHTNACGRPASTQPASSATQAGSVPCAMADPSSGNITCTRIGEKGQRVVCKEAQRAGAEFCNGDCPSFMKE